MLSKIAISETFEMASQQKRIMISYNNFLRMKLLLYYKYLTNI